MWTGHAANARVRPDSATLADVVLAALVALLSLGATLLARGHPDAVGALLLVGGSASLALRRRQPVAALLLVAGSAFAYDVLDQPGAFYTIPIAIALYSVADAGHRLVAVAGLVAIVGGFLTVGLALGRGHVIDLTNAAWFAGWLAASLVLGEVARARRAYLEEVERRALEAERTREEEARRRAGEERIRIARELHDVLAHRISLVNVQAGVGAHLIDRDPEQARAALVAIRDTSREALAELRATLGVLRQVDEAQPRAPVPGLAQLDRLLEDARAAGLDTTLETRGVARELPTEVDLAAYRIVQESITNVLRHARARRARITLAYLPDGLELEVTDDGAAEAPARPPDVVEGNGLAGMRERAAALGGSFEAGRRLAGAATGSSGFRVRVRLPTASG